METASPNAQNVIIETERLRLTTWVPDDSQALRTLATDPLVTRYLGTGQPWPDERIQQFVARQIGHWEKHRFCLWKLRLKESDALIGLCGLQPLPEATDIEIGWWLSPSRWGQGLASEAARHALAYGFEVSSLDRIVAVAQPANRDSRRVMDRIGMHLETEMVHRGIPVVVYAIDRAWFNARHREE